jgi:hypothetical protein
VLLFYNIKSAENEIFVGKKEETSSTPFSRDGIERQRNKSKKKKYFSHLLANT